jgi:hypothetical protein
MSYLILQNDKFSPIIGVLGVTRGRDVIFAIAVVTTKQTSPLVPGFLVPGSSFFCEIEIGEFDVEVLRFRPLRVLR